MSWYMGTAGVIGKYKLKRIVDMKKITVCGSPAAAI